MMKPIAFRRILCPINFGDGSQRTVEGASLLAAMYDAELRLFHVVSNGSRDRDAERLIASLFALTRSLPGRTRVSAALAYGDPLSEIVQHAQLMEADAIVLGTDRRSPPADVPRTLVARVATHAGCPVLHVRPNFLPSLSAAPRGFTEIVCCADPAPGSLRRGDYAHALAQHGDARITVLNILADQATSEPSNGPEDGVNDVEQHVVRVSLTGSPGPEIVGLARRIQADLIVMDAQDNASPGKTLCATTAHVMVHAPCPVLIVPPFPSVRPNGTASVPCSVITA